MEVQNQYEEVHQGVREMIHEQPETSCEDDVANVAYHSDIAETEEEPFNEQRHPLSDDQPGDLDRPHRHHRHRRYHEAHHTPPDSQEEDEGDDLDDDNNRAMDDDEDDPDYEEAPSSVGDRIHHPGKSSALPREPKASTTRRLSASSKSGLDDGRRHNGRPPKLSSQQLKLIETTLEESQGTLSSTELLRILKFDVSARTIRRAKRAIMEKRCQARRNSVIMAARSLAAAAAAVSGHNLHGPAPGQHGVNMRLLKSHRRREELNGVAVQ